MLRWSLLCCGDIATCQFSREGALTITHLRLNFIVVTGLTAFILARLYRQEGGGCYLQYARQLLFNLSPPDMSAHT